MIFAICCCPISGTGVNGRFHGLLPEMAFLFINLVRTTRHFPQCLCEASRQGEGRLAEAESAEEPAEESAEEEGEVVAVRARGLVSGRRRERRRERRGERRDNSTLLERVLLSGGSVPPFANGRVVVTQAATAPAQNATTTVPAGFTGEPAAQDPDEWW